MRRLFVFGLGYTGLRAARAFRDEGWQVAGTCREPERRAALRAEGIEAHPFAPDAPLDAAALDGATHLLATIPPDEADGADPALRALAGRSLPSLAWVGYLSTTGVYGDHRGGWVDEDTPPAPDSPRSARRLDAERAWLASGLPVHVFRLSGIYGPGRSAVDQVRAGAAKRIDKPGHVFGRIHVDDIVGVLRASIARPHPGRIYNVTDDEPAPSHEVVAHACRLLGVEPPPLVPFDPDALSPMARSFYAANRRVRNGRIKAELGVRLAYPTYREGLAAVLAEQL